MRCRDIRRSSKMAHRSRGPVLEIPAVDRNVTLAPNVGAERRPLLLACGAVIALLAAKAALIWRINVNWDEFYFLTTVHALVRGELHQPLQTAFAHLFTWLPGLGDEMTQIAVARMLMLALLAWSAVLIAKLASRWVSPSFAWFAPLCFLANSYVMRHGGSFRVDSLLLPLGLLILLWLTSPATGAAERRATVGAGVSLGLALAASFKAILIGPVAAGVVLGAEGWRASRPAVRRLVLFGLIGAATAVILLLLHRWSLPMGPAVDAESFATRAVRKTLIEVPFFPRWDYLQPTLRVDKATWLLVAGGAVAALWRRNWAVLACGLSLLPLLFYRNAFPYYYLIMLAPACVLAAFALQELHSVVRQRSASATKWVVVAVFLPLVVQALVTLHFMRGNEQAGQRATIAAVHRVFPQPVPYIDHSGMIASFRKVNFFMSSWGVESYLARGRSFMREAIDQYRPPLLLANRGELEPGTRIFSWLLPEDQALVQRYVRYWGTIYVAGAHVIVPVSDTVTAYVPFPGRYRLESTAAVRVDGVERAPGDTLDLTRDSAEIAGLAQPGEAPQVVRLIWADAKPAPTNEPLPMVLYRGL
jgi:hypothetical protein